MDSKQDFLKKHSKKHINKQQKKQKFSLKKIIQYLIFVFFVLIFLVSTSALIVLAYLNSQYAETYQSLYSLLDESGNSKEQILSMMSTINLNSNFNLAVLTNADFQMKILGLISILSLIIAFFILFGYKLFSYMKNKRHEKRRKE